MTLTEFKVFLGVIINMALNPKPELKGYFSQDIVNKMPFFSHVYCRRRFLQIFCTLPHAMMPVQVGRQLVEARSGTLCITSSRNAGRISELAPKFSSIRALLDSRAVSRSNAIIRKSQRNGACVFTHLPTVKRGTFRQLSPTTAAQQLTVLAAPSSPSPAGLFCTCSRKCSKLHRGVATTSTPTDITLRQYLPRSYFYREYY